MNASTSKKKKLSLKRKRASDKECDETSLKVPRQKTLEGCPICKDGQPFEGRHQCIKCERYVHPWCVMQEQHEGYGSKVVCLDCGNR